MTATRAQIVTAARSYLGTRYVHQGRNPATGLDCAGLLYAVCVAMGSPPERPVAAAYPRRPDGRTLIRELETHLVRIPAAEAGPGDVLLFAYRVHPVGLATTDPTHLGILGDGGLIHASNARGRVVEEPLGDWRAIPCRAYRFPFLGGA